CPCIENRPQSGTLAPRAAPRGQIPILASAPQAMRNKPKQLSMHAYRSYLRPFTCEHCRYDLSGTPARPGGRRCSECGRIALGKPLHPGMNPVFAVILSCIPTILGMGLAAAIAGPMPAIWTGVILGCLTP